MLIAWPDRHIHWAQTEYFVVEKGVIGIMKNGKEHVVTAADGIVEVPAGTRCVYVFSAPLFTIFC
jgi:mannose-6-phosphate isomerase-like protein (cupin superfamily)